MTSHLNDPGYWRARAEELHAIADSTKDTGAKATILACAADYDVLAGRADWPTNAAFGGR